MLTGRQIREARKLLGMDIGHLARRTKVFKASIIRAEMVDDEPPITIADAAVIQRALERAGAEFVTGDDGAPSVRMRKVMP